MRAATKNIAVKLLEKSRRWRAWCTSGLIQKEKKEAIEIDIFS